MKGLAGWTVGVAWLASLSGCASVGDDSVSTLVERLGKRGYRQAEAVDSIPGFRLSGWNYVDEYHIQVDAGPGHDYLLSFTLSCRDLETADRIGHTTTAGTLGRHDRILARGIGMPLNCPIDRIYRLQRLDRP